MKDKLDKTIFTKQTHKEASNNRQYWLSKTVEERLVAAYRLTLRAYGLDPDVEHKLNKTYFIKGRRGEYKVKGKY